MGAALLILYFSKKTTIHLSQLMNIKINRNMIEKILNIGIPFGIENSMFYLGRLIVLSIVSLFGTASIAANSVGGTLVMFQVLPGTAINLGLTSIISRCIGANDYDQANLNCSLFEILLLHHCKWLEMVLIIQQHLNMSSHDDRHHY